MKQIFAIVSILALTSPYAFAAEEHACDKMALAAVAAVFGPSQTQIASSTTVSLNNSGSMGQSIYIKITLSGDLQGDLTVQTLGPGDSEDCNIKSIRVGF